MKRVPYIFLLAGIAVALACGCAVEPPTSPAEVATTTEASTVGGKTTLDEPVEIGYFSRWCGKVNMVWRWTSWEPDPDCNTGCNVDPVAYCQKFFPGTNYAAQIVSGVKGGWVNQGCVASNEVAAGQDWVCLM